MSASETSGLLENGCFGAHPSLLGIACALLSLLAARPAEALKVRVGSASRIDAQASLISPARGPARVVVQGVLRDDFGAGIASEHVAMVFRGAELDGAGLPLPPPEHCRDAPATDHAPHVAPDEYVVDTDPAGAFCIQTATPGAARVELRFAGNALVEPSQVDLLVALTPAPALGFDPPLDVLHLDGETIEVGASLAHVDVATTGWTVRLRDELDHDLGQATVRDDGRVRWEVPTVQLSDPGAGEMIARLEGPGAPPLVARQRVERHARVAIELVDPPALLEYREGARVALQLHSSRGVVPGGWVEARAGGRTLVTTAVRAGSASLSVRELPFDVTADVELRYWPDAPWWEAGPTRTIRLLRERHGVAWVRGALVGLAMIVAAWMLRGSYRWAAPSWWRERRARAMHTPAFAAVGARERALRVVRVGDAHDAEPLVGALAEITVAAFPVPDAARGEGRPTSHDLGAPRNVIWSARTDPHGVVSLPERPLPSDAVLRISSPLHVAVTLPVPQATESSVCLLARRRHILERFARWAARELGPSSRHEPTPREAAQRARRSHLQSPEIDAWTNAVESAAFAATPVDEHIEGAVLALEPTAAPRATVERPVR